MTRYRSPIAQHIDYLTAQLEDLRDAAMQEAGFAKIASFHGVIGSKNNTYIDSVRQVFLTPGQFISEWIAGAIQQGRKRDKRDISTYGKRYQNAAVHRIISLLKKPTVRRYMRLFLKRTFFREYDARRREKPSDDLWEIWFGPRDQEYGLFITPRLIPETGWENDVSEIRRVQFHYWTIGHALSTGFVVPGRRRIHAVASLDALFDLLHNVFVRPAGSTYGVRLAEIYEDYVRSQSEPERIPLLIPEFRYRGAAAKHKYRLDFTILSAERKLRVGVELSPWSTHGRVRGKKALRKRGGEAAIEKRRKERFENEMDKRNEYFAEYGISVLTFTDKSLKDMDNVFDQIETYLAPHTDPQSVTLPEAKAALDDYTFDS